MRFMLMMIPAVYQCEAGKRVGQGFAPPAEMVRKMMKYNEELTKAGALITLDGLTPPSMGARISFEAGKPTVTDGPFIESKELLGGYWMIKVESKEAAVEWARRVPAQDGDVVEVRQVFDIGDYPPDVQEAANNPVVREQLTVSGS